MFSMGKIPTSNMALKQRHKTMMTNNITMGLNRDSNREKHKLMQ